MEAGHCAETSTNKAKFLPAANYHPFCQLQRCIFDKH
jgi:hypothetical protein